MDSSAIVRSELLRSAVEWAWAGEAIPSCNDAFEGFPPDTTVTREYYCGRHWHAVDFSNPDATFTGVVGFKNRGLRYYIAAFLWSCLDLKERFESGQSCFGGIVLPYFDAFFCDPESISRVKGAKVDQLGCVLGTGMFIDEHRVFYHPGFLPNEVLAWKEATALWMAEWGRLSK
ncbi:MAG TPA: hypothetical protein VGI81_02800 [Tepidisphaeraceae bacterium]|jgi:hypothetical protein